MDAKITLSFDQDVIAKAKVFAHDNHISLSRLTEFLYKITDQRHLDLEDFPVSDWVKMVAEGQAEYKKRKPSDTKGILRVPQMRLFLDANILVSVLNKEYPIFMYSARILSLADERTIKLFTSPTCIAIAFYFASKKNGGPKAKEKIASLRQHIQITTLDEHCVMQALNNPQVNDLEDGIQYYTALKHSCEFIITENVRDFHFSDIQVRDSESFLKYECGTYT